MHLKRFRKDISSGNTFGMTTCLVRNMGDLIKVSKIVPTQGKELRKELKRRGIWRKHPLHVRHDQ